MKKDRKTEVVAGNEVIGEVVSSSAQEEFKESFDVTMLKKSDRYEYGAILHLVEGIFDVEIPLSQEEFVYQAFIENEALETSNGTLRKFQTSCKTIFFKIEEVGEKGIYGVELSFNDVLAYPNKMVFFTELQYETLKRLKIYETIQWKTKGSLER